MRPATAASHRIRPSSRPESHVRVSLINTAVQTPPSNAGQSVVSENIDYTLMNNVFLTLTLSEQHRKPSYYPEADVTLVKTPPLELLAHVVPSIEQHNLRTYSARPCSRSLCRSDSYRF